MTIKALPVDAVLADPRRPFPPKKPTFIGDRFALVTWSLTLGAIVLNTADSLGRLLQELDDHCTGDESTVSVCEVVRGLWVDFGGNGSEPLALRTLYEIQHRADATEDGE